MPPWAQWLIALAGPGSLSVLLVRIARRWEYCGIVQGFWIRAGRWSGFSCATGGLSWRPVLWLTVVAVLGPAAALAKADAPDEARAWIEALGHARRSVELAPDSAVNRLSPAPVDGEEAP